VKNVKAGLFLLISQLIYGVFLVVWLLVALMSFLMFDTPEALADPLTVFLFVVVWLYPLAVIGTIIASWVLYHKRKFKGAACIGLVPLLWLLPILFAYYG